MVEIIIIIIKGGLESSPLGFKISFHCPLIIFYNRRECANFTGRNQPLRRGEPALRPRPLWLLPGEPLHAPGRGSIDHILQPERMCQFHR